MAKSDWVPVSRQVNRTRRPTGTNETRTERQRVDAERRRQLEAESEQRAEEWLDGILREADAAEERTERARQARSMARTGANPSVAARFEPMSGSTVKVGDEPAVYGPGSDFSWFRDRFLDASFGMGAALPPRTRGDSIGEVRDRLMRNQKQMAHLATRGTDSQRATIRSYFRELNRPYHGTSSDRSREDWRDLIFGGERRDVTTGSGSLG